MNVTGIDFNDVSADDLKYLYNQSQSSAIPINMPFEEFSSMSASDKSEYLVDQYQTHVNSLISNPTSDQEFSNSLIDNSNKNTLGDDVDDPLFGDSKKKTYSAEDIISMEGPYSISSGDTLSELAETFNTDVDTIKALNNLENDNLQIGQKLIMPGSFEALGKEITTNEADRTAEFGWDADDDGINDSYAGYPHLDELRIRALMEDGLSGEDAWQDVKYNEGGIDRGIEFLLDAEGYDVDYKTIKAIKDQMYGSLMNPETYQDGVRMLEDYIAQANDEIAYMESGMFSDFRGDQLAAAKAALNSFSGDLQWFNDNLLEKYQLYNNEKERR